MAIAMVVAIHVASTYFYNGEMAAAATANWRASTWVMGFLRPAVPLFLMISGTLMLQPGKASEPLSNFFKKRIARVAAPFLIWSAAFVGWRIWFFEEALTAHDVLRAFFQGTVYVHLWFMYVLLALYVATPVLRQLTRNMSQARLAYVLSIWLVAKSLIPLLQRWWGFEISWVHHLPLTNYLGFFLGGYYLSKVQLPKSLRPWLLLLYGVLAIATGSLTLYLNSGTDQLNDILYDNLGPNTILMATCLFLWLKDFSYRAWAKRHQVLARWVKLLSRFSFGIYLMHLMLIDLFQSTYFMGLQINALPMSPFLTIPLFSAIVLVASMLILALLARVPGGRAISP